jgi:hypothetical protein
MQCRHGNQRNPDRIRVLFVFAWGPCGVVYELGVKPRARFSYAPKWNKVAAASAYQHAVHRDTNTAYRQSIESAIELCEYCHLVNFENLREDRAVAEQR